MDVTLSSIRQLSDRDLVSGLDDLSRRLRGIGAVIIAHLLVVKERNIHLDMAYSSLIEYGVERLGCSRDVAYKWAAAVKVAEAHPEVLTWLADGDITTSALAALARYRDDADLVVRSRGMSRRQIQMMCAAKHPDENWNRFQFRVRSVAEGLSKIEMTVPDTLLEQLEEALDLDSHLDPGRDRVGLLSRALETYIDRRKRERQKTTDRPRPPREEETKVVPARAIREAYETSGGRCTYVSPEGRRCTARAFLELDHIIARACGGANDHVRILCRDHNQSEADKQLGKERMEAVRQRARLSRALRATLKKLGFSPGVARRAARGAVEALGGGAELEVLVKEAHKRAREEALERTSESRRASGAREPTRRWNSPGAASGTRPASEADEEGL
jgi:5-methylcytosine-specific restriction endonuclease McrA